jgi:hypothetical protein
VANRRRNRVSFYQKNRASICNANVTKIQLGEEEAENGIRKLKRKSQLCKSSETFYTFMSLFEDRFYKACVLYVSRNIQFTLYTTISLAEKYPTYPPLGSANFIPVLVGNDRFNML